MEDGTFARVDAALVHLGQLAARLEEGDRHGHVKRCITELQTAFAARAPIEPAVGRVLRSLQMVISRVGTALEAELLPALRQLGFEV
jgi:hypothetical protein